MIPVQPQQEYPTFDAQVRQRGQRFLASHPNPTTKEFKKHNYWKDALGELHAAYQSLCAYTSRQLVQTGSVDHFMPTSRHPHWAYEWDNYRLARQAINSRKGNSEEVIDPFTVQDGWFILDMPSCLIRPGTGISVEVREAVKSTIHILGLNSDERLVQERCELLIDLADGDITLNYLERHYPFLAAEVRRQQVCGSLKELFSREGMSH